MRVRVKNLTGVLPCVRQSARLESGTPSKVVPCRRARIGHSSHLHVIYDVDGSLSVEDQGYVPPRELAHSLEALHGAAANVW